MKNTTKKVTISIEGVGKLTFKLTKQQIISLTKGFFTTGMENFIYDTGTENLSEEKTTNNTIIFTNNNHEDNPQQQRENPFANTEIFKNHKLVGCKCKECGDIIVKKITLAENNTIHCAKCNTTNTIEDVKKGNILCPNCGVTTFIYLTSDVTEIKCIGCKSPIDVIHYENGKKVVSAATC